VQPPAGAEAEQWDTIIRLRGLLEWAFSDDGTFSQEVQVESGELNTYMESVTSLKSQLIGSLALRLSYTIQHNSDVPVATENTDRVTSVALEYAF
jgi:putative salt-induced outer membrane protein